MSQEIIRVRFPKQRDFVRFVLRKNWSDVHRVQLKDNAKILPGTALAAWCNENISGRWSRSDANEVFYFETLPDAMLFRLRWAGMVPEIATANHTGSKHV